MDSNERTALIRDLNDDLRCRGTGGEIVVSAGLHALGLAVVGMVLRAVGSFNAFTPENDPHEEHDCALVSVEGLQVL